MLKEERAKKLTHLSPDGTDALKTQRDISGRKKEQKEINTCDGKILPSCQSLF